MNISIMTDFEVFCRSLGLDEDDIQACKASGEMELAFRKLGILCDKCRASIGYCYTIGNTPAGIHITYDLHVGCDDCLIRIINFIDTRHIEGYMRCYNSLDGVSWEKSHNSSWDRIIPRIDTLCKLMTRQINNFYISGLTKRYMSMETEDSHLSIRDVENIFALYCDEYLRRPTYNIHHIMWFRHIAKRYRERNMHAVLNQFIGLFEQFVDDHSRKEFLKIKKQSTALAAIYRNNIKTH